MPATSLEAIRRITMEAREKGFDEVAAKLDKITKAQEGVVASSTSVEKSAGSTEQAFKRVERQLDSSLVAYQKYASQVKAVNDQLAQNPAMQKRATELIGMAETRLRKATGATENFGDAAGPARHEWINLSRQLQDIGVSLQGGMPLLTVIAQQGSQLSDAFISSKASMGDWVAAGVTGAGRFLAAWGPVIAVVTAAGAAAALAMRTLAQEREARIATTSGLGRMTAIGAEQVPQLAERARGPGMTLGDAREGVLDFIKAGATATTTLEGMALATRLATTTGSSLADAYKLLAGVIRDPAAAAKQLDEQFQILGVEEQRNIANMVALGDRAGAARAVFEALSGALVSGKDATTAWNREWTEFITIMETALDRLGKFGPAVAAAIPKSGTLGEAFAGPLAGVEAPQALGPPQPGIPNIGVGFGGAPAGAGQPLVDPAAAQASAAAVQAATAAVTAYEAEVVKAGVAANNTMTAIADSARAFELQKAVMMATTVETRAAATEAQALNEATKGLPPTLEQEAAARQRGNLVRAESAASQAQLLAAQQAELGMGQQLIAAAGAQGAAGAALRASLQEELSLRQRGIDVTTRHSQTLIENAGALARQKLSMQDAGQAAQLTQSIQGQIQMLQLETQMIGANAAERARAISLLQSEIQARELEAQGFEKSAAAVRKYASALAEAKAQQVQAQATHAEAQAGGGGGGADYGLEYHNQQAQMLREIDMLGAQIEAVGMSAGAAAEHIKLQELENQALATTSEGAADAIRDNAEELAGMTRRLVQAQEAEQDRKRAIQEAKQAEQEQAAYDKQRHDESVAKEKEFLSTKFESTRPLTWLEYQDRARKQDDKAAEVRKQAAEAERAGQQRQLSIASSTIQDQISALQDQKSAIGEQTSALDDQTQAMEDNTNALEKETSKRREQLDKQIAKLEKALTPSRPDPYAERNPDYFYRFGTQAFKENDPTQALLAAAEAERDGLDKQLDAQKEAVEQQKQQVEQQKKAVELQQKAIDEQIKGYETQAKQLDRAGNLLSSGVELSAQEVSGLQAILGAIGALGDYARLQQANVQTTLTAQQTAAKSAGDPAAEFAGTYEYAIEQIRRGKAYEPITPPTYGFQKGQKGFSGFFAAGGYIPPGSWGIAGESGPEVVRRKRAVAGPATVTPIGAGRPIVVNQTFVSQAGAKDLRASRGEIAQRSSSEMRRSLGAR